MSVIRRLIITLIVCINVEMHIEAMQRFVYHKDISEQCKRRVIPSVFIGRNIMGANSQMLHFTRLELPYSCFITIRTESGTNIVLVVQLLSSDSLEQACSEGEDQVLVYEMAETFGGYWGPLPETMMRSEAPTSPKIYTLQATKTPEITPDFTEEMTEEETTEATLNDPDLLKEKHDEGDFITIDVPLLNVSGKLVPSSELHIKEKGLDFEDTFDFIYDVLPRSDEKYETSIMPLVQFSVWPQRGARVGYDSNQTDLRYQLDYEIFTPDSRLTTFPTFSRTPKRKFSWRNNVYANRRLKFRKSKRPLFTKETLNMKSSKTRVSNVLPSTITKFHEAGTKQNEEPISWKSLDDIIRIYNKSTQFDKVKENVVSNMTMLLQKISNMKHNFSAYLAPNLSIYNEELPISKPVTLSFKNSYSNVFTRTLPTIIATRSSTDLFHKYLITPAKLRTPSIISSTSERLSALKKNLNTSITGPMNNITNIKSENTFDISTENNSIDTSTHEIEAFSKENNNTNTEKQPPTSVSTIYKKPTATNHTNANEEYISSTNVVNMKPKIGSLVDRESWENVVNVAPALAVFLNRTVSDADSSSNHSQLNVTEGTKSVDKSERKKRHIQAITINDARPHNLTTSIAVSTTSEEEYQISDMQDFAQLVELQDDEHHGRIALRYLRQYVGAAVFNICNYDEPKSRYVYLFNSSRIVIAISNFTMDKMTIVVTPAHTLLNTDAQCQRSHLECQVSGTRVCIDSTNSCDSIPNCGANDIYDEDRVLCGFLGIQHNVCLAAFTFLAVLLTFMYSVHYWLRRCVPKVSDAFFIYTDAAENILFLDSVMRSPEDYDNVSKAVYLSNIFMDDDIFTDDYKKEKISLINQIKRYICCFCCKKQTSGKISEEVLGSELYALKNEPKQISSFTKLELYYMSKKLTDVSVQTGGSLEMAYDDNHHPHKMDIVEVPTVKIEALFKQPKLDSELNLLKFFKDSKSDSLESNSLSQTTQTINTFIISPDEEEKEIESTFYQPGIRTTHLESISSDILMQAGPSEPVVKKLRFDEETTTIPSLNEETSDSYATYGRRSIVEGSGKSLRAQTDLEAIDEDDEKERSTTGRDFMRFWGKSKKSNKKKAHLSIR